MMAWIKRDVVLSGKRQVKFSLQTRSTFEGEEFIELFMEWVREDGRVTGRNLIDVYPTYVESLAIRRRVTGPSFIVNER